MFCCDQMIHMLQESEVKLSPALKINRLLSASSAPPPHTTPPCFRECVPGCTSVENIGFFLYRKTCTQIRDKHNHLHLYTFRMSRDLFIILDFFGGSFSCFIFVNFVLGFLFQVLFSLFLLSV